MFSDGKEGRRCGAWYWWRAGLHACTPQHMRSLASPSLTNEQDVRARAGTLADNSVSHIPSISLAHVHVPARTHTRGRRLILFGGLFRQRLDPHTALTVHSYVRKPVISLSLSLSLSLFLAVC